MHPTVRRTSALSATPYAAVVRGPPDLVHDQLDFLDHVHVLHRCLLPAPLPPLHRVPVGRRRPAHARAPRPVRVPRQLHALLPTPARHAVDVRAQVRGRHGRRPARQEPLVDGVAHRNMGHR